MEVMIIIIMIIIPPDLRPRSSRPIFTVELSSPALGGAYWTTRCLH